MPEHGPFDSESDALATEAAAAVRAAQDLPYGRTPAETGQWRAGVRAARLKVITDACETAGIVLGDYDRRLVEWLADWETAQAVALAGIIRRAWDGGSPRAHCRHCGMDIEPCPHPRSANPVCKGWRHEGYENKPIGAHYCGGRSINPSAEPATGPGATSKEEGSDGQVRG